MFVRTTDGGLVNTAHIVSVASADSHKRRRIVLSNGEIDYLESWVAKSLETAPVMVVPAGIGCHAIIHVLDDPGAPLKVVLVPIISWSIDSEGAIKPVTTNGVDNASINAILMPDGMVVVPDSQEWARLQDYLDEHSATLERPLYFHPALGSVGGG